MSDVIKKDDFLKHIFDAMPIPVLVVDSDVRIFFFNKMGGSLFGVEAEKAHMKRGGEALICENSMEKGCGRSAFCNDCVLRNSSNEAMKGKEVLRRKTKMRLVRGKESRVVNFLITAAPFEYDKKELALLMLEDISTLIQLRSLLPICANCKKIRDDEGHWKNVDEYLGKHIDVDFTHSFCPECIKLLYPDYYEEEKK